MRPLAVEALAGAPEFVSGVAVVRGRPTPVVDLARLLSDQGGQAGRFVTLRVQERQVAVAVEEVEGIFQLDPREVANLPPLLSHRAVAAVGRLDAQLLLVLQAGALVPPEVWEQLHR